MRQIISIILLTLTVACHAEKNTNHTCTLTAEKINLITPASDDIATTFWQKGTEGYESISRLHIVYKNGSIAVVEHKYCSMYNFEIAYYTRNKNELSDVSKLTKTIESLFSYSAIKNDNTYNAITAMAKRLEEKGFDLNRAAATAYDHSTPDNKRAEYSISFAPLEDSSLHRAALFIYMGVGGEH